MKQVYVVDPADNVGTVIAGEIKKGTTVTVNGKTITARADIPYGHKIALTDIPKGSSIIKYGLSIGTATADIKAGDHVHIHNVESNRGRGDRVAAGSEEASL